MHTYFSWYITCALLSNTIILCDNQQNIFKPLNDWTSSLWQKKRLGGDTPYNKNLFKKKTIVCPEKIKEYVNFYEWQNTCYLLPHFNPNGYNRYMTALDAALFTKELDQVLVTINQQQQKIHWVNEKSPNTECTDFQTYAEKLIIPTDALVAIHGDIHGDIHSMNRFIQFCADQGYMDKEDPFTISAPNFYILFLGDYVDRGWYGVEVIYAIMRLKNANPDRVFMVRGNHEDLNLNNRYGFSQELSKKFANKEIFLKVHQFYNQLPAVLYLGSGQSDFLNIVQCCHGGIELGFNPHQLLSDTHDHAGMLITHLMQKSEFDIVSCPELNPFKRYLHDIPVSSINGFMWNDFIVDPTIPFSLSDRDGRQGSMFDYGYLTTRHLLRVWSRSPYVLRSVFRAHQHGDPAMKARILNTDHLTNADDIGIGKLWPQEAAHKLYSGRLDDIFAVTFCVAPDTGYGYPVHAFGLLKVAEKYEDWHLQVIRLLYKPYSMIH